jgi:uncharacterized protein (TIGR02996 family)
MTQEKAFLQAIFENPDDDAPRLIYADWLDENGQPDRAEFIRLQCELEKVPAGHLPPPVLDRRGRTRDTIRSTSRNKLIKRAASLLKKHGKQWAGPLRRTVRGYEYRRGFIEAIEIATQQFIDNGEKLFQLAPIRHAWLINADDHLDDLLQTPLLRRLTGLDVSWNYVFSENERKWTTLLTSPNLRQLRTLRLEKSRGGGTLSARPFNALMGTSHFKHLTELDLMDQELSDKHIKALAAWPCLARVGRFDLTGNTFQEAGAKALARSPYLKHLVELNLSYTHIGDAGWETLLSSANLAHLTWLGIDDAQMSEEVEEALKEKYGEEKLDREAGY